MINFKKLCLAFVVGVFLSACGNPSAEEVALDFTKTLYKGDIKATMKFFDLEGADPEEVAFAKDKVGMGLAKAKKETEAKGGIKEVAIADKEIRENDARIQTKIIFKDGSKKSSGNIYLAKKDKKWFVKLK